MADTGAAARKAADEGIKGFNLVVADQIDLMQKAGDRAGAMETFMGKLRDATKDAQPPLTELQKSWKTFMASFSSDQSPVGEFFANWITVMEKGASRMLDGLTAMYKKLDDWIAAHPTIAGIMGVSPIGAPTGQSDPTIPMNRNLTPRNEALINGAAERLYDRFGLSHDAATDSKIAAISAFASNVMQVESSGRQIDPKTGTTLTSPKGAMGLMQLMPATASRYSVDPHDAGQNVQGGLAAIYELYVKYQGDLVKMAIAYNWGETAADKFFKMTSSKNIPDETLAFASKTTGLTPDQIRGRLPEQFAAWDYRNATLNDNDKGRGDPVALNTATRQGLNKALEIARQDLSNAVDSGDAEGFSLAIKRIADYTEKLKAATGAATQFGTEAQKSARAAAEGVRELNAAAGPDRAIAEIRFKYEDIAKRTGNEFDEASFGVEAAAKLKELSASYSDATAKIEATNAAQRGLSEALAGQSQAAEFAKNATIALNEAEDKLAKNDPERTRLIKNAQKRSTSRRKASSIRRRYLTQRTSNLRTKPWLSRSSYSGRRRLNRTAKSPR